MKPEPLPLWLGVLWAFVFLAHLLWFLTTHRNLATMRFVIHHVSFHVFLFLSALWFTYEDRITTLIFGHVVYKHSPEAVPADLITVAGFFVWVLLAVLALGRNR